MMIPTTARGDDASYFRARALQEQIAAQKSTGEAARSAHDTLAAIYRFRTMMLARQPMFDAQAMERELAEHIR